MDKIILFHKWNDMFVNFGVGEAFPKITIKTEEIVQAIISWHTVVLSKG